MSRSNHKKFGRVDTEAQTGEEVTAQYVDLQARLANSKNTEQRLTDVLRQRTGKLSDVLEVETEIARVRGEIESMEAERKTMATQVAFATLNLTLTAYSLAPCWDEIMPYYGLFVERGDLAGREQGMRLAESLERRLCEMNVEYAAKRESARLGPVRLIDNAPWPNE